MNDKQINEQNVKPGFLTVNANGESIPLINEEYTKNLDDKLNEIREFLSNNNGEGKTSEEKDKLFADSQTKWKELTSILQNVKYNFYLNRTQYSYLNDLLRNKMEYDRDSVFFALELVNMLDYISSGANYSNDVDFISYEVTTTEITYTYHLISNHKVKGISKATRSFAQILEKIGTISKIVGYYDTEAKNLSNDINNWIYSLDAKDVAVDESSKTKKTPKKTKTVQKVEAEEK